MTVLSCSTTVAPPHDVPSDRLLDDLVAARSDTSARRLAAAERALVLEFLPTATRVAHRHRGRGVDVDDLIQVARVGLVKAVRGWRPQPNGGFLQYAVPMMNGEVQRHLRDRSAPIRLPRRIHELRPLLIDARHRLEHTGQACTPAALAREAGVEISDVRADLVSHQRSHPQSFDAMEHTEDRPDLICLQSEHDRAVVEDRAGVREAIRTLTESDRHLLALRFFEDRSQREIAHEIGVSQMQISRLLSRILAQLRSEIVDDSALPQPAS